MMRAKTIVLSLSGPGSHTIVEEPGRGDLCIGPESSGNPSPDVVVAADQTLNWPTFDPLKVPAGYSWPRHFHYRGNDHGFFTWSERRYGGQCTRRPDRPSGLAFDYGESGHRIAQQLQAADDHG
jgi:hypothetical protein